jgi:hypothetical protein
MRLEGKEKSDAALDKVQGLAENSRHRIAADVKAYAQRPCQIPKLNSASVVEGKLRAEIKDRVSPSGYQSNARGSIGHHMAGWNSNVQIGLRRERLPARFKKIRTESQGLLEADDLASGEAGTENASQFQVPDHVIDREIAGVLSTSEQGNVSRQTRLGATPEKEKIQKDSLQRRSFHQKASKEICPPLKFPAAQLAFGLSFLAFPVESVLFWTSHVVASWALASSAEIL